MNQVNEMHSLNETFISPRRLVFMQFEKNCMFCTNPQGSSYTQYVNLENRMGYVYCNECRTNADETVQKWRETMAYGRANYLKGKEILIKRSSGVVEYGWELHNPFTSTNSDGIEIIQCYHKTQDLARWCRLEEILELNPPLIEISAQQQEDDVQQDDAF